MPKDNENLIEETLTLLTNFRSLFYDRKNINGDKPKTLY